jgi:CRISPR/Cas system-associated exonuclease Cas4 (RecB family)
MYQFNKDKGYFALANKLTGEIKLIEVPFDYEYVEKILKKAERIYECLEKNQLPESCSDISVCENCDFAHICTANINRAEIDVDVSGELDELIEKKQELSKYTRELEDIKSSIKKLVGDRDKILTGKYIVERKVIHKLGYMVNERDEERINVKRL